MEANKEKASFSRIKKVISSGKSLRFIEVSLLKITIDLIFL